MDNKEILEEIASAKHVLVIQGENPDGDSLASALALEEVLESSGHQVTLFCAVDVPRHLRFLDGWDRVVKVLPGNFDVSLVIDTAAESLLEKTFRGNNLGILRSKQMIVIDHHDAENSMPFSTMNYIDTSVASTGEALFNLFDTSDYEISLAAMKMMTVSILYDTRGLSTEATTPQTLRRVAHFVEQGVSLAELEEARWGMNQRDLDIAHYKGELLRRIEVREDIGLATVDITWEEIEQYSDRYNPAVLVLDEMRLITGVGIAIAYKTYPDGKILAKIRSNRDAAYSNVLAEHFGGGGHPQAAGFKLYDRDFDEVKREVVEQLQRIQDERP